MAQHESGDNNYNDLARSIREAAKNPHAGMESVPEDVREQPVHEFDTPLDEAVNRPDIALDPTNPPEDVSGIKLAPAEIAALDQKTAARRATTKERTGTNGRKIAIGGTAVALILGAGAYLGLGRGHDNSSDPTGPNQQPNPTATANSEGGQGSTQEHGPIVTPLDASVDSSVAVLNDNQLELLNNNNWPNTVESTLNANIKDQTVNNLTSSGYFDELVTKYPDWTSLYGMYTKYNVDGIINVMGNRGFLNTIYNRDYAGMSALYGQPQNFRSPDTAKLIGAAPIIKISDFDKAAQNGDFTPIWNEMYPQTRDYDKALLSELKAGNTDPAIVDQFVNLAMVGNELQGNLDDNAATNETRELVEGAYRNNFNTLYNDFLKDPAKAEADYETSHAATTKTDMVLVLDAVRQLPGQEVRAGNDATVTVTTAVIYRQYTMEGTADGMNDGQYGELSLVAFVAAPTKDGKNGSVMPIILEHTSHKLDAAQ